MTSRREKLDVKIEERNRTSPDKTADETHRFTKLPELIQILQVSDRQLFRQHSRGVQDHRTLVTN